MNTTISVNKSSHVYECFDSYPGVIIAVSSFIPDLIFFLPLHFWTLFISFRKLTKEKTIPAADVFTIALSVLEIVSSFGFFMCIISLVFNVSWIVYIAVLMLGKYLIGRPVMNSLICLERFIAVVYPLHFHKYSSMRLRCVCVMMAVIISSSFGAQAVFTAPDIPLQSYSIFLLMCLLCITACSLGVLMALLKPSPGKENMRNKKKRAFVVLTSTLAQLFLSYFLLLVTAWIETAVAYDSFCLLAGVSMWFLRPSSAIQPVLFLTKYKKLPFIKKYLL